MERKLSKKEAYEIAKAYLEKYEFASTINPDLDESVVYYESFFGIEGIVWIVIARFNHDSDDERDELSFIVSDAKREVEYVMDYMGVPYSYHLTDKYDLTDEMIRILEED